VRALFFGLACLLVLYKDFFSLLLSDGWFFLCQQPVSENSFLFKINDLRWCFFEVVFD